MSRLFLLLVTSSATLLVFGLWIPLKAVVAQELLELAWAESQARQTATRPWPWADTWPVGRLTVPELDQSMIVLAGGHGESLAFGPGQVLGSDYGRGPTVIAGHRDTHFDQLKYLKTGSELRLQGRDGGWRTYRVLATRIVDSRSEQIDTRLLEEDTLLLVTCYPFDSMDAGGPLRYVVEAQAGSSGDRNQLEQIDTVAGT
ncbi:class GN sortase [Marinobacter arenosus]|uniref:class GN sortase n=1 Tax=Marinobacter arenosus TaxID=2856822 RepID=UPI001C4B5CBF|nr:class GN sortase [Marinobacter arenosus]MBW0147828.1 class GN sortase [Marinobacter arenosus]